MISKLQYITTPPHIQNAKAALEAGCKWIQLRVKEEPENPSLEKVPIAIGIGRGLTSNIQNPPLNPLQGRETMLTESLLLGGDLEVGNFSRGIPSLNNKETNNLVLESQSLERNLGKGLTGKTIPLNQLKGIDIETNRRKIIPYNSKLKEIASNFRKSLTKAETILWSYLKGNKMCGFDFDRQRPIFEFIVDFYCKDLMLAIELDGKNHDFQYHKDKARQSKIEEFGVTFLRFTNEEVYKDIDNVLRTIEIWIETQTNQNPPINPLLPIAKGRGEIKLTKNLLLGGDLEVGSAKNTLPTNIPSKEDGNFKSSKLPNELIDMARTIQMLCIKHKATLIINDNIELAKLLYADGVHIGLADTPIAEAREYLGTDFIIGGTANTFEDVVKHYEASADYVGLGPFKFTETKKNLSPVLGLEGYKAIIQKCKEAKINIPIIAIGGITLQDIPELIKTGVSGIAVASLITNSKRKNELISKINTELNGTINNSR